MSSTPGWVEIVPSMPSAEARDAYEQWKVNNLGTIEISDDDIRIDLIRTMSGDERRYRIREEALRFISR